MNYFPNIYVYYFAFSSLKLLGEGMDEDKSLQYLSSPSITAHFELLPDLCMKVLTSVYEPKK